MYGKELILDLDNCDPGTFTRESIERFFVDLCVDIGMERCEMHFWDYEDPAEKQAAPDHLAGTSAIQFITTSNVTIHTLDRLGEVYLNIFSCKDFDASEVEKVAREWFAGRTTGKTVIQRG